MSIRVCTLVLSITMSVACGRGNDSRRAGSVVENEDAQRAFWSERVNIDRLEAYVRANARFALFHEMAHYIFHVLDVPIAGREEDAADRLAALLMTPRDAGNGPEAELTASPRASDLIWVAYSWIHFGRGALVQERGRMTWYDEHSIDEQRGYDVLCLLYGNNPERFALAAKDRVIGIPDDDRLQRCVDEAARNARAFEKLVGAFVLSQEEVARKREAYLARWTGGRRSGSGSAAIDILQDILQGRPSPPSSGSLTLLTQPAGVFYQDYESAELWWSVPWMAWDSNGFLRIHDMLEAIRDELLGLRLPADATLPTIEAKGCRGQANAFYGVDPDLIQSSPELKAAFQKGLIAPTITICYPLVDAFSWAGRTLIWQSEQEKAGSAVSR